MILTILVGPRPDTPEEAVAAAFAAQGLEPRHVITEEAGPHVWRWKLNRAAPTIVDKHILRFTVVDVRGVLTPTNPRHPAIEQGVASDDADVGWVIVVGDAEGGLDEGDLLAEAWRFPIDLQAMSEGAGGGDVPR